MPTKTRIVDGIVLNSQSSTSLILSEEKMDEIVNTPSTINLHRMIDAAVSEQDWIAIFQNARSAALNGDKSSRDFLVKYRFGLPATTGPAQTERKGIAIVEVEKAIAERTDAEK